MSLYKERQFFFNSNIWNPRSNACQIFFRKLYAKFHRNWWLILRYVPLLIHFLTRRMFIFFFFFQAYGKSRKLLLFRKINGSSVKLFRFFPRKLDRLSCRSKRIFTKKRERGLCVIKCLIKSYVQGVKRQPDATFPLPFRFRRGN